MSNPSPRRFLPCRAGDVIELPTRGGLERSVHVIDEDSIFAVDAALATGRPLLVRGEPGTGKSQLARAAAEKLGRTFLPHSVDGRTETRDLLWTVDAVARLAQAQVMGAIASLKPEDVNNHSLKFKDVMDRIDLRNFVAPGPLWWAFDWASAQAQAKRSNISAPETPPEWTPEHGVVVLIDEIDKADAAVPNGLLDALGHGRFDVPGGSAVTMDRSHPALVVITTNEERALPDAFLRRCLVLHLGLPEQVDQLIETLIARGRAHFPECSSAILKRAAELVARDREALHSQDLALPGLAEYIDLVRAVIEQRAKKTDPLELLERIAKFALRKHPPEPGR